jgi:hypothetical protein
MHLRFFPFILLAASAACKPIQPERDANASPTAVTAHCTNLTETQALSDAKASLSRGDHVLKGVAYGGFATGVDTPGVFASAMPAKRPEDPGYRVDVIAGQFGGDVMTALMKTQFIGGPQCQQTLMSYALVFNKAMLAGDPVYALHFGAAVANVDHGQADENFEQVNAKRKGWRAYILRPLNDPRDWITSADRALPVIAEAIRSKVFEGSPGSPPIRTMPNVSSTLLLEIGPDGHVARCVANSIVVAVGQLACDLVTKRARFVPMRNADGTPRNWKWGFYVDWGNEQRPLKTSGGISAA